MVPERKHMEQNPLQGIPLGDLVAFPAATPTCCRWRGAGLGEGTEGISSDNAEPKKGDLNCISHQFDRWLNSQHFGSEVICEKGEKLPFLLLLKYKIHNKQTLSQRQASRHLLKSGSESLTAAVLQAHAQLTLPLRTTLCGQQETAGSSRGSNEKTCHTPTAANWDASEDASMKSSKTTETKREMLWGSRKQAPEAFTLLPGRGSFSPRPIKTFRTLTD